MKRRIISGLLAFLLVFSNVNISAFATSIDGTSDFSTEVGTVVTNVISEGESESGSETESVSESVEESASAESESDSAEFGAEIVEDSLADEESDSEDRSAASENEAESVEESTEAETETETETEETTVAVTEELEELVLESPLRSTTQTFLIDTESPYTGEYLLAINTNADTSASYESSGTLPASASASAALYAVESEDEVFDGIDTEEIYGLDKWGRGLIDPQSHLPELEVSDSAPVAYSQRSITAQAEETYAVDDARSFFLENGDDGVYNETTCYCVAVGEYCTVWVPDNDPIYSANPSLMKEYMETLAEEFDKQFPKMTEMFGSKETADVLGDNDGKTALLCYDINGDGASSSSSSYVGGYFFAADLAYPRFSNATGSNSDCLHIDSWQGMSRDTTNNVLNDVLASQGTIVHELQHMINFAICRDHEPVTGYWPSIYNYTITTPTYLNEAYSMAAEHLCYGDSECYQRVWYYNRYGSYGIANGDVSLFRWGYYDTLSNYALSYLFGQYIRTQYENDDTIYRDTMNELDADTELLTIIADKLGVTEEDLLFNFRAALCLKNATGEYGFRGEKWADSINLIVPSTSITGAVSLYPGAAVVVPMNSEFIPSGAGDDIAFAAMYPSTTDTSVADPVFTVEDIVGGKSVSLQTATSGAKIYYTLDGRGPDEDSTLYKTPIVLNEEEALTIKAVAVDRSSGTKKVSNVVFETVEIGKVKNVFSSQTETDIEIGTEIALSTETENAEIYYTTDGSDPYVTDTKVVRGVLYTGPITMGKENITIRAQAVLKGNVSSDIVEFVYRPIKLTDIILSADKNVLYSNMDGMGTAQMAAVLKPEAAGKWEITWKSSNPSIATVNENGLVTAVAPGTVKITAEACDIISSYDFTVKSVVTAVELTNDFLTIQKDKGTLQLNTVVYPADASDQRLTYTIDPTDRVGDEQGAATVDENGLVTAIRDGVVKVTIEPTDNVANVEPIEEYITISNQKSYNSTYMPKVSSKTVTLNKQAEAPYELQILPQGEGTKVQSVVFSETNVYAQYFVLERKEEGSNTWAVALTDAGRTDLKRGTYKIPVVIQTSVAFGNISFEDTFSYTMSIQVKDTSPKVTLDKITVNQYYSKKEYPLTVKSSAGEVEVLGLLDVENTPGFTDNFVLSEDMSALQLAKSVDEFTTYRGRKVVKGYLRVKVEGYVEQTVPITVSISTKAPTLSAYNQKFVFNFDRFKASPEVTVQLFEKISSKEWNALEDITAVDLNTNASNYEELSELLSEINAENGTSVTLNFNAEQIKAKTYRIPLLISTEELVGVPVVVTITVQRQSMEPKLTLERNTLKLNRSYSGEVDSVKVKSINQTNVELTGFTIAARTATAASNVDNAVTLTYDQDNQCLSAQITEGSKPGCWVYLFDCQPLYADDVTSNQKITVTVKVHESQASVRVSASGSIDALNRENSAVVYKVSKVNFTDDIKNVTLKAPSKTSNSILDGSNVFTCEWNENTGKITVKAKADAQLIKGKKYAFRFCVEKEHGLVDGGSKKLLTSDITITPSQSSVRFFIDKTPVFYRYVSEQNNTQEVSLYTNIGTISSAVLKEGTTLPAGITLNISDEGKGISSISFDGIDGIKTPGTYTCQLDVVMEGQLCEESTGKPKPMTCRVRIVIH